MKIDNRKAASPSMFNKRNKSYLRECLFTNCSNFCRKINFYELQ